MLWGIAACASSASTLDEDFRCGLASYLGKGVRPDMWALADLSPYKERVRAACLWFRVVVQSGEDEEVRRMLCQEAYGWIERAMR